MSEFDTLDDLGIDKQEKHQDLSGLKTIGVLTIVGNSILTLIFLGLGLFASSFTAQFGFNGSAAGVLAGILIVVALLPILCIFGAAMMMKGKKSGFLLYLIPNSLYVLLTSIGTIAQISAGQVNFMGIIFSVILPIAFIIMFSKQLHNLR